MYNLNEEIGRRITALRKKQGLTQEKLAEALNCSIKHVSHVVRGVSSLSLDLLIERAEAEKERLLEYLYMYKKLREKELKDLQ